MMNAYVTHSTYHVVYRHIYKLSHLIHAMYFKKKQILIKVVDLQARHPKKNHAKCSHSKTLHYYDGCVFWKITMTMNVESQTHALFSDKHPLPRCFIRSFFFWEIFFLCSRHRRNGNSGKLYPEHLATWKNMEIVENR